MALFTKKQPDIPRRRQSSATNALRPEAPIDRSGDMFRRNRTLTGTTSNQLTASGNKNDLESPRTRAHNLTVKRRKISGILLTIIAVAGILFWLLSQFTASPVIALSDTSISHTIDNTRYEKVIQTYLQANPLSRLRFALDQRALSQYVSTQLPEVASVEQKGIASLGTSRFVLTMRNPVAGWKIGDSQYYVDASGVPFQINYFGTPGVQITDESGVGVSQGTSVVSNSFLGFVGRVVAQAKAAGYDVTQAIIPSGTTRQLEVRLNGITPLVKLSIDRPAAEQVEDMSRAVTYFTTHGEAPQYIDVRVSGKAFYR